jgi:hypothetical protein
MRVIIAVLMLISLLFGSSHDAFAYIEEFSLGESKITVFAPDWIWQG